MMYLQRLIHGIARVPEIPDNEKILVENEGKRIGWGCMHEKLIKIDPDAARKINKNDSQRIARQSQFGVHWKNFVVLAKIGQL